MKKHQLDIDVNGERNTLAILSPIKSNGDIDSGYRFAGPKAWGGYSNYASYTITETPLVNFVRQYCENVVEALKNDVRYLADESTDLTVKVFKSKNSDSTKVVFSINENDFHIAGDKSLNNTNSKEKHIRSRDGDILRYIREYCTPSTIKRILA